MFDAMVLGGPYPQARRSAASRNDRVAGCTVTINRDSPASTAPRVYS